MSKKHTAVEGANIALIEKSQQGELKVPNSLAACPALEEVSHKSPVIVDARTIDTAHDRSQLAAELSTSVVPDDECQPYVEKHLWLKNHRVLVRIVQGQKMTHERELE
jgi:hypothetical protein